MTRSEPITGHDKTYRAEYAKSGGSVCRRCRDHIGSGALRIAVMVHAATKDSKVPHWFHNSCFWKQNRVGKIEDIEGIDTLRPHDQKMVQDRAQGKFDYEEGLTSEEEEDEQSESTEHETSPEPEQGREEHREHKQHSEEGRHRGKQQETAVEGVGRRAGIRIFKVDYAKSNGSRCVYCDEMIIQNDIRVGKRETESGHAMMYGPRVLHHHVKCFADDRDGLGFTDEYSIEDVPGFNKLRETDQKYLKDVFGGAAAGRKAGARRAEAGMKERGDEQQRREMDRSEQGKVGGARREMGESSHGPERGGGAFQQQQIGEKKYTMKVTSELPDVNAVPRGISTAGTGGAVVGPKLPETPEEQENYMEGAERPPKSSATSLAGADVGKPLENLRFFVTGRMSRPLNQVRQDLEDLGATIVPEPDENVVAAILSEYKVKIGSQSKHVRAAKEADVHIVSEEFVNELIEAAREGRLVADPSSYQQQQKSEGTVWLAELVMKHSLIPNHGSDVAARIRRSLAKATEIGGRHLGKSTSENVDLPPPEVERKKMKKVTRRTTVDPESGLEDEAHVLEEEGGTTWSILLHSIPEASLTNFYYRLQLVESNDNDAWWVYRSWGRVGTAIGSNKLDFFESKDRAKQNFEQLFLEKTGTLWNNGEYSSKEFAGRYYPIDETDVEVSHSEPPEKMSVD